MKYCNVYTWFHHLSKGGEFKKDKKKKKKKKEK